MSSFISSLVTFHFTLHTPLFFSNDPPPTEIYTLSLHDALPICSLLTIARGERLGPDACGQAADHEPDDQHDGEREDRSEEHTSELQSHHDLVCRLLLEKKKKKKQKKKEEEKENIVNIK